MANYSEPVIGAPFEERPCPCVKQHSPTPIRVELHHIYPQAEQKKVHGKLVDKETVPLCDTGHANVHTALTDRLKGKPRTLRNKYQQWVADEGFNRIQRGLGA